MVHHENYPPKHRLHNLTSCVFGNLHWQNIFTWFWLMSSEPPFAMKDQSMERCIRCTHQSGTRCTGGTLFFWYFGLLECPLYSKWLYHRNICMQYLKDFILLPPKHWNPHFCEFQALRLRKRVCWIAEGRKERIAHRKWEHHDDVMKWKHFPRYWPFVRGIHRSPVNFPHKDQWRGALMFPLICVWISGWINNGEAGDLRRHRAHYDVIIMRIIYQNPYAIFTSKCMPTNITCHEL